MKKISAIILVFLVLAGWSRWGAKEEAPATSSEIELLSGALSAAGAQPLGGELHAWARSSGESSLLEIEATVEAMVREFGLKRQEYEINSRSSGQYTYAQMEGDLGSGVVRVTATSQGLETTIEVDLYQCPVEELAAKASCLKKAFATLGAAGKDVKITTCLEGTLNARLKNCDKLNLVYVVFNSIKANYRGAVEAKGVSQWSGWTPLIPDAVDAGGKLGNFGLSLRWEADASMHILRVATPVLPSSY